MFHPTGGRKDVIEKKNIASFWGNVCSKPWYILYSGLILHVSTVHVILHTYTPETNSVLIDPAKGIALSKK